MPTTKAQAQQAIQDLLDLNSINAATMRAKLLVVLDYVNSNSINFKGVFANEGSLPSPEVIDEVALITRTALYHVNELLEWEQILSEPGGSIIVEMLSGSINISVSCDATLGGELPIAGNVSLTVNTVGSVFREIELAGDINFNFSMTGDLPPDPQITWLGPPGITGASGDFDLVETSEAVFIMIEATGMTKTTTNLARLRFRVNGGPWIESTDLYKVDSFAQRYCGQCGVDEGQISAGDTVDVELVERTLIGTTIEAANTKSKSIVTRDRQLPAGSRTVNVSSTAQLVSAINNAINGDRIELASGSYSYSGSQFNLRSNLNDLTIVCTTGIATLDGSIADTYSWTQDGDGSWFTTDIASANDLFMLHVDGSPLVRFKDRTALNVRKNGFTVVGSTVYVRIDTQLANRDPNDYEIQASQAHFGFNFSSCQRLWIENIRFLDFNLTDGGTGGNEPQAARLQDCTDVTLDNVILERCGYGFQFNGTKAGLTRRNCRMICTDTQYVDGSDVKASSPGGDKPFTAELYNVFWALGTDPNSYGIEILDEFQEGGFNGMILINGSGTFPRPTDRIQSAILIARNECRNQIDGFELDGTNQNVLIRNTLIHGRMALSLAPNHYGPVVVYNSHLQHGWIPAEETQRLTREGMHFTFGTTPNKECGTLRMYHCTVVARVNGEAGAPTLNNQFSTQGGGSNMGAYVSFQIEDLFPFPDCVLTNCIFHVFYQDTLSNDPLGWIFSWLPGGAGNGLDSDQDGFVWNRNIVFTRNNNSNNAPFFEANSGQSVAAIQTKYPGRFDAVVQTDPQFTANRLPQATAANTVDTITGINLPKMGANIPYTYVLP